MPPFANARQRAAVMIKLRQEGFNKRPLEVGVTEKYFRARMEKPSLFTKNSFKTIDIGRKGGTKAVIGKQVGMSKTKIQSVLIPRSGFRRTPLKSDAERKQMSISYSRKEADNVEIEKNKVSMDYGGKRLNYPFTKVEHLETIGNWKHKIDNDKIIIDRDVKKENVRPLLVHEAVEQHLVKDKGLTVDEAHKVATNVEKSYVEESGKPWKNYNISVMKTRT